MMTGLPLTRQGQCILLSVRVSTYSGVRASNNYGCWNEEPIELAFSIKGPVYQTAWFIILCITVLATLIYLYISLRERNLRKEKELLEEMVEERTAEVVTKSVELEEKNRDTTASIRYAERIQACHAPSGKLFQ